MSLWGNCFKKKGGDGLRREAAVDRGDPTTASPGGHHFQENFRIINVSFYLYKPFHSHGEHAFWICCHQEVDSAIAGFEPGSQPPRSAAEILLATLAQVLPFLWGLFFFFTVIMILEIWLCDKKNRPEHWQFLWTKVSRFQRKRLSGDLTLLRLSWFLS